jgi:hypothetical protein
MMARCVKLAEGGAQTMGNAPRKTLFCAAR